MKRQYSIGDLIVMDRGSRKDVLVVTDVSADSIWLNDQELTVAGKGVRYLMCDVLFWQHCEYYKVVK